MSSQQAEDAQVTQGPFTEEPPGEEAVTAYLEATPDFFERQRELAARLRIPHGPAGAVSLIEHQVSLLRSQLDTERRRLTHLIARARDYETLSARLHALVLQLITAPDLARTEAVLREAPIPTTRPSAPSSISWTGSTPYADTSTRHAMTRYLGNLGKRSSRPRSSRSAARPAPGCWRSAAATRDRKSVV